MPSSGHPSNNAPVPAFNPVDPDVDLHDPAQQSEWSRHRVVLPVIAAGGSVGATARHLLETGWPTEDTGVPWTTLGVNACGCLLIGVLMVWVVEVGRTHPLVRPFLGAGVLGGFTTFSTYTGEVTTLLAAGRPGHALGYLAGTVLVALAAVITGVRVGRAILRHRGGTQPTAGVSEA